MDFLSDTFISNGYSIEVVDKFISCYISPKHKTRNEEIKPQEQLNFENALTIPYIKAFSDRLRRDLKEEGINVVFTKGITLGKKLCKLSPEVPKEMTKQHLYETLQRKKSGDTIAYFMRK